MEFKAEDGVDQNPIILGNSVCFGGSAAYYCLDAESLKITWQVKIRSDYHTSPAVAHDMIYLEAGHFPGPGSIPGGTVYAIDPKTGKFAWTADTKINGIPQVGEGVILTQVTHIFGGRKMAALDSTSGKTLWEFNSDADFRMGLLYGGKAFLYKGTQMVALDVKNGKEAFRSDLGGDPVIAPLAADGRVITSAKQNGDLVLRIWDPAIGKMKSETKIPGAEKALLSCLVDGEFYFLLGARGSKPGAVIVVR